MRHYDLQLPTNLRDLYVSSNQRSALTDKEANLTGKHSLVQTVSFSCVITVLLVFQFRTVEVILSFVLTGSIEAGAQSYYLFLLKEKGGGDYLVIPRKALTSRIFFTNIIMWGV